MIRFFVCKDIISFIEDKTKEIDTIINTINQENVKPFFIYTYSIFESTITEILRYYFNAFPEKLDKINNIEKEQLLSTTMTHDILTEMINSYIRKYSSDTLYKYLSFFNKAVSIDIKLEDSMIHDISQLRNRIIHDDVMSELLYKHVHTQSFDNIDLSKTIEYIQFFKKLLMEAKNKIQLKYNKFTKEKLIREVWGYIFSSPLLNFDSIWKFDNSGILCIQDLKLVKKRINGISGSEHLLLAVFFQQYNRNLNKQFNSFENIPALVSIDSYNKNKLVEIISFFKYYPLFFNGEKIIDLESN